METVVNSSPKLEDHFEIFEHIRGVQCDYCHFSQNTSPSTTTWIWNLHADAHDFNRRTIFSTHFCQLSIIFLWLNSRYFHGTRFPNYEAWLSDPTHIASSAQVVWP
ncbi:hypothetical protein AMTRI_Chr10g231380 [Amborella trichopoda]